MISARKGLQATIRISRSTPLLSCAVLALSLSAFAPAVIVRAADSAAPALYSPDHDPTFAQPYVDVDEWRDAPVRHRYIHGGFRGTDTRFSFYFPDKAHYQGHFFQWLTPVPVSENTAQAAPAGKDNLIGMALDGGAYFVETNGGGLIDLGKVATSK